MLAPIALTIVGMAGVLAILAMLAPLAGLHVARLDSGSMAPEYPAESLVLTRDVAASATTLGEIVTVMRPDGVSVTHRVTAIDTVAGHTALTLRGDANPADDPEPYIVDEVSVVVGGIPWGGQVVAALGTPLGMGIAAAIMCLTVLWACWPRRDDA